MSIQGDTELRDLVSQTLENAGVLAKIRAELRASVFLVLEEHEAFKGRHLSFTNKPLKDFLTTQEGIIIVNLIREFLEYFGLEYTASVFEPETQAGKDYEYVGRSKLSQDLKLNSGKKLPLIAQVLQESKICFSPLAPTHKEVQLEKTPKKDKVKDERKNQENNSYSLKSDVTGGHTNGVLKSPDISAKDILSLESKSILTNSPTLFQSHMKKPDSLKLDLNQINLKQAGSSLASLGNLPPLGLVQNNQTNKLANNRSPKQVSSDIKALLDFGSDNISDSPEHNYEEDFNPSGSEKTSKDTDRSLSGSGSETEEEEEVSVGVDDHTTNSGSTESGKLKDT